MKIISKYKDYYDSIAQQKGIDGTIIFERHETKHTYEINPRRRVRFMWDSHVRFPSFGSKYKVKDQSWDFFMVGFCGKIYIAAKHTTLVKEDAYYTSTPKAVIDYAYGMDEIKSAIENHMGQDYWRRKGTKSLDAFVELTKRKDISEFFHEYKTPQFVLTDANKDNLVINACLKDVQFFKAMDPFMAFQEIEMYISGVLGVNTRETVTVSDKDKIIGRGFDYKYSFRKEPTKNK